MSEYEELYNFRSNSLIDSMIVSCCEAMVILYTGMASRMLDTQQIFAEIPL